jgi:hypothetical protein
MQISRISTSTHSPQTSPQHSGVVTLSHPVPEHLLRQAITIEQGFKQALNHEPVVAFESPYSDVTPSEFNAFFTEDMRGLLRKMRTETRVTLAKVQHQLKVYQGLVNPDETQGFIPEEMEALEKERHALHYADASLSKDHAKLNLELTPEGLQHASLLLPPNPKNPMKHTPSVPKIFLSELEPPEQPPLPNPNLTPVLTIPNNIQETTLQYWMRQPLKNS